MNVKKVAGNITIRPTDRKMKQAKHLAESTGVLPKEMPLERNIHISSVAETFERIKDGINIAIDKFKRQG